MKNTQSAAFEMVRLKANSMVAPSQPPVPAQAPGSRLTWTLATWTLHFRLLIPKSLSVCEITLCPRELSCTRRTSVQGRQNVKCVLEAYWLVCFASFQPICEHKGGLSACKGTCIWD